MVVMLVIVVGDNDNDDDDDVSGDDCGMTCTLRDGVRADKTGFSRS